MVAAACTWLLPALAGAAAARGGSIVGVARLPAGTRAVRMMVAIPDASLSYEKVPGKSEARVTLTIPAEATREVFDGLVRKAKGQVNVDGFKKGAAPEALVIGAVGRDVLASDAIAQLLEHYGTNAIGNHPELNAIGEPQVVEDSTALIARFSPGKPLDVNLDVELWPEVEVEKGAYENLDVEIDVPKFNTKAYDETLKALRERQAKLEDLPEGRVAQEGDVVRVDMTGYEALPDGARGQELNVASGEELTIELVPGRFMPGLVEGLLGAKAGERREVPVEFSQRSQQAQLAGKKLLFDVEVKAVQTRVLPELDDALAKSIDPTLDLAGLHERVRQGVQAEMDKMVKERLYLALEDVLVDRLLPGVAVPDTLVTEHARKRFATMLTELRDRGEVDDEQLQSMVTPESFDAYKEETRAKTENIVRASLLVDAIARLEGIRVDKAEIEEQKAMMKQSDPEGIEKVDDAMLMTQIEATMLREKVLGLIAEKAKVTKTELSDEEMAKIMAKEKEEQLF